MFTIEEKRFPCTTSVTMRFIGGKWKAVILIHLVREAKRYNEILKKIPTITERTLSIQLKQLEEDGLIKRNVYAEKPPLKVEYELTDFGKTLLPLLREMSNWGKIAAEQSGKVQDEVICETQ